MVTHIGHKEWLLRLEYLVPRQNGWRMPCCSFFFFSFISSIFQAIVLSTVSHKLELSLFIETWYNALYWMKMIMRMSPKLLLLKQLTSSTHRCLIVIVNIVLAITTTIIIFRQNLIYLIAVTITNLKGIDFENRSMAYGYAFSLDFIPHFFKTSQELRMLSSVTINCQITKIVMNSGSQLSEL